MIEDASSATTPALTRLLFRDVFKREVFLDRLQFLKDDLKVSSPNRAISKPGLPYVRDSRPKGLE